MDGAGLTYRCIDLCAGIGGIRRGFELTGHFSNVLSAEVDDAACKTYRCLFPHDGYDPKNDVTSDEFFHKVLETEYDVMLAGFPCQAFSAVGKKLGFKDTTRGTIFFSLAKMIEETRPRGFFLENVENLIRHNHGDTFRTIIRTLDDELDYKIVGVRWNPYLGENGDCVFDFHDIVRTSRDFGVPQNRPRVYLMGFDREYFGEAVEKLTQLPRGKADSDFVDPLQGKYANGLADLLDPGPVDKVYYLASGYWETLKRHKKRQHDRGYGFGYSIVYDFTKPESYNNAFSNTVLATGGSGKERNLVVQPVDGYAGALVVGKKTPLNNEGVRMMTPEEWGRLQGFIDYAFINPETGKDEFKFPEGTTRVNKYKQFGNAVTIPVIKVMADFMYQKMKEMKEQSDVI